MTKTDRQTYVVIAIVILIAILVTMLYCIPAKAETITVDGKVFEQYVDSVAVLKCANNSHAIYYINGPCDTIGWTPVLCTRYVGEADSMVPFPPDTVENWIIPKPVDTGRVVEVEEDGWLCPSSDGKYRPCTITRTYRVTNCREVQDTTFFYDRIIPSYGYPEGKTTKIVWHIDTVTVCDSAIIEGR